MCSRAFNRGSGLRKKIELGSSISPILTFPDRPNALRKGLEHPPANLRFLSQTITSDSWYHALSRFRLKSGTLYLLPSTRPLSRVFARIPCNPPSWSPNNNLVGRGARRCLSVNPIHLERGERAFEDQPRLYTSLSPNPNAPRSAKAETWSPNGTKTRRPLPGMELMNSDAFKAQMEAMLRNEDKEPDIVVRRPTTEAELNYPAGFMAELEAMLQEEERKLVKAKPHFIDSIKQVFQAQREALLGEGHKELNGAHGNTKRAFIKAELAKAMKARIEAGTESGEESRDPGQFLDRYRLYSTRRWEPSDQIYVMGSDLLGRYIATVLAGTETIPPVRFLIHRVNLWKEWQNCGRRMLLERATGPEILNRIEGEFMSMKADEPVPGPLITNLIVTVPPGSVVRALEPLKHRLDHRSTICLIHDGLGVAEAVIKAHFPDEHTRPAFILGHMTTSVGYSRGHFSVVELQQGRLYLSVLATKRVGHLITRHPPPERTTRYTSLLNLLITIPDLNASSHPLPDLLRHKLPALAMLSIVQPLAAIFGVPWDELLKHHSTKQIMTDMLWEVCHVVSRMPECRTHEPAHLSSLSLHLQKKFISQFHRRKGRPRKVESEVYRGWETDINYLTGYFIGRAAELKVPVPNLKAIYKILQGKKNINAESINNAIPFEESEVTLVGDLAPIR